MFSLVYYKYSESQAQRQTENEVFKLGYAEAHPILFKYKQTRAQRQAKRKLRKTSLQDFSTEQKSKLVKSETHRQELDMKEKELSRLARIIDKAFRWFPMFREMLRMEKFCAMLGFSKEMTESLLVKKEALKCSGKIYSEQHRRNFDIKDDILRVENDPDDESRLNLTINRKPITEWFREQWHRLRYGTRQLQPKERKSRGFKL